jgi:predicted transcriptional regulator
MARDVMTLRLERTTRRRLQAAAKRRRVTPSAAARTALEHWLLAEERREEARPYDAMADLLGAVRGGDPGRSTRGSKWISGAPRSRARRRRR